MKKKCKDCKQFKEGKSFRSPFGLCVFERIKRPRVNRESDCYYGFKGAIE